MYHLGFFEKINLARPGRPLYQRILLKILCKVYRHIHVDGSYWRTKLDNSLKKLSNREDEYYINYIGMQGKRELFPRNVFFPTEKYVFEDMEVDGPRDYEKYLTQLYGAWRQPPENKETHPMELVKV